MRIDLRGEDGAAGEALRLWAEQRLLPLLDCHERGAEVVTIRLGNQPGRLRETRCRLVVRLVPWARVVVEEIGPDAYTAIDRAAKRLARAIWLATQTGPEPARCQGDGAVELSRA